MQKAYTLLTKIFFLFLFSGIVTNSSFGQQDPMFTQYMFNSLTFNPAYAGSKNYLSANILYRTQWAGWNSRANGLNPDLTTGGAPVSQTFTIHTPVNKRIGVGLAVVNDKVGASESTGANLSYAYRIPFAEGNLALAVQGGVINYRGDFRNLIARDIDDPAFIDEQPNVWRPNFGTGIYYNSDRFYAGVSVPRLLEVTLRDPMSSTSRVKELVKSYRHFYFTMGGAIPLNGNQDFVFKPSFLVKSVGLLSELERRGSSTIIIGAPTEFDIDASLFLYRTFWVGLSFRSSFDIFITQESSTDSADAWVAFYLKNGLRLGFAYDFSLTPIQQNSVGSFEMSVGYDFNYSEVESVNSPRYF
jgi:type IX secretion system PorP/SprF family membrane protein